MGQQRNGARVFEDVEAKRARVPLMVGLVGPSGTGKTFSALRLAKGIQRVNGGDIFMIDTEARRALHYAEGYGFKFRHVPFDAPFGPLDYLAAVEHCARKGAGVVVIDSMSHEHEGPGGVLEMHDAETKRLAAAWHVSEAKAQMSAWSEPKAMRRRMINTLLQLPISTIFCFRAKEKLRIVRGKDPEPLGWMAIAGEELVYEMTVRCLLLPGARGVPTWDSKMPGEQDTAKLPDYFVEIFRERAQLSEDIGEHLARWAEGGPVTRFGELMALLESTPREQLEAVFVPQIQRAKEERAINPGEYRALKDAYGRKTKPSAPTHDPNAGEVPPEQEPREPGSEG